MKIKDIATILNIGDDSVVVMHCIDPGNVFVETIREKEDLKPYEDMEIKELTLSGYGGSTLYIDMA